MFSSLIASSRAVGRFFGSVCAAANQKPATTSVERAQGGGRLAAHKDEPALRICLLTCDH
jgi:hypothetical protein